MKPRYLIILFATFIILPAHFTHAQSLGDLWNAAKKAVTEKVSDTLAGELTMTGTWNFQGSAIALQSDNLLSQAGSALAESTAEQKLDGYLSKVGLRTGASQFTFNADSTFTATIGGRTIKGTYAYDAAGKTAQLKIARVANIKTQVELHAKELSLLFEADKLLDLLTQFGNKSNNTSMKAIAALAKGYDGLQLGMKFSKQEAKK
ncbi:MAG: DUF4923 family protein [Prevotellaceae bacterium]|jgi:hypothetical protein|nr:DUF4923 family protein [Prevotellaceae bacterium]